MTRAQLDKRPADVAAMFDQVAGRYDLLNDVLSLGQDRWWRKVVANAVAAQPHGHLRCYLHRHRGRVCGV